jgi:beta-aspartyl-peptidase (threonine type)
MRIPPALIVHGGAGARAPAGERAGRRHGLLSAVRRGAEILVNGGAALDAIIAAVVALEDNPLFNAGFGSCLTLDGRVEMDAAVTATRLEAGEKLPSQSGGVVMVSRVRNPILLARAVMEHTPHLLIGGIGAEQLARQYRIPLVRSEAMIAPRARERWQAMLAKHERKRPIADHGTVGAAALDNHGNLAAGTSTGGVLGKLRGRIGDSAILGAGFYADEHGAASATGQGEGIMQTALCRTAVEALRSDSAQGAAKTLITHLQQTAGSQAGIIIVDRQGGFGFVHNAGAMEIATFTPETGALHRFAPSIDSRH